jgi:hypothetical protein
MKSLIILGLVLWLAAAAWPSPQRSPAAGNLRTVYISFDDAREVVSALREILPEKLSGKTEEEIRAAWPQWVAQYDASIRQRLAQGDEDSLVNFVLFGTSFTKQSRVTLAQLQELKDIGQLTLKSLTAANDAGSRPITTRVMDLVAAAALPRRNDRLTFAQKILSQRGGNLVSPSGRQRAADYLVASLQRVIAENSGYARVLEAARLQGDATEEFAERSRLFRARGLSSDTSLLPNYAIEEALKEIKDRGLAAPGSVQRVAIIGPGLDFTDKQEGYDFYPQQTIQPFAIMDSLLRLGLAKSNALHVVTLDLSSRVNDHLRQASQRARRGIPYVVQLPRDEQSLWKPGAIQYWQNFGDQIGAPVRPVSAPPTLDQLKIRAVKIRPSFVARIQPFDTNIVLQRLELPPAEKFDLIIATNIFVYYDNFDQSLAMINVERMLGDGGLMLSNNAMLELPFFKVRSAGYSTVVYSDRADDGDHIVWYKRLAD